MIRDLPASVAGRVAFGVRWCTSMFCFVMFGLGGLLFGVVAVPLVSLTTRSRELRVRRLRRLLRLGFRLFVRLMSATGSAAFAVQGEIPRSGNYLIIANHPTLFDAVVLLALFPQADCIIKQELLRNPFTRFALSGLDYVSNADTADMLAVAVSRLRAGRSLLVFPEGTRSPVDGPLSFHLAAATIAVRAAVPCLPVVIRCEPRTTAKEEPWYRIAPRRPRFRVRIEAPLDVARITQGLAPRYAKRALNQYLQDHYNRALGDGGPAQRETPSAKVTAHSFRS